MRAKIHPAIMIGGSGTRLWPLSRENRPKQFLHIWPGGRSLFQETVARLAGPGFTRPWLMSNAATLNHAEAQLPMTGVEPAGFVVEPAMRGTAAAIAAVAGVISRSNPEALVLAAPSDHLIERPEPFLEAIKRAVPEARAGAIVTFGIVPTAPETGFGYIRRGDPLGQGSVPSAYRIPAGGFLEKPSRPDAEAFIAAGYMWNAGIFLFRADSFLAEMHRLAPATAAAAAAAVARAELRTGRYWHLDASEFAKAPADLSVDYAVMEKTDKAVVVPCDAIGWSDVGSLSALWDTAARDGQGNALRGDVLVSHSTDSLVYALGSRKVVAAHLADMIVVDTDDCVVVLPREKAQSVRDVVKTLKEQAAPELVESRYQGFPWGSITVLERAARHSVLRLDLAPDAALNRTGRTVETWTVVSGRLHVQRNGRSTELEAGGSASLRVKEAATFRTSEGVVAIVTTADRLTGGLSDFVDGRLEQATPGVRVA